MNARKALVELAVCLIFFLMLNACKRDSEEPYHEITGRVYSGCPKQPAANKELRLHMTQANNQGSSLVAITTTDNYGYFKLKANFGNDLLYCDNQYITTVKQENIYNIEIHLNASTFLKINLNVSNPYSANDTLYIMSHQTGEFVAKIPGPFNSGFLLNDTNYTFDRAFILNNPAYVEIPDIRYYINNFTLHPDTALINTNLCDTSNVTFEIN